MLRKLLACLALLTGLAAAGTPAQAEVASAVSSQLQVSASLPATERNAATVAFAALSGTPRLEPDQAPARQTDCVAAPATIRLGSDRARE